MLRKRHLVDNGDGWLLSLTQAYEPDRIDEGLRPVAIVPGYGMNAFIFGYHPTGKSMEAYWAERGLEVWSLNLRAMGDSSRAGGDRSHGFYDAAVTDLNAAFRYILEHTRTRAARVDGVGCSLGGTYLYVNVAVAGQASLLGSIVAIGAPLRWVKIHPLLRAAFCSPRVARLLAIRGVRPLARIAMPVLVRAPGILDVYLHPEIVDMSKMKEMIRTIENPNRRLNGKIAEWVRNRDLVVRGINVTEAISRARNPLLVVLSNADGIVPEEAALAAYDRMGSSCKRILRVGTDAVPVAHADMFVSEISQEWVFEPLAEWLLACNRRKGKKQEARGKESARGKGRSGRRMRRA